MNFRRLQDGSAGTIMLLADFDSGAVGTLVAVAVSSWLLVGALRRYAIARGILDRPQQRSSHLVPTPRGGGAGLVAVATIGYIVALPPGTLDWRLGLALAGVIPTAVAGWIDDRGSLAIWPRIGAHLASGLMLLPLALGPSPQTGVLPLSVGWLIATISAINVVNFIDGIDGLIGLQAFIFAAHLSFLGRVDSPGQILGIVLAAASTGFLVWNWAPARIFLGDVGSGALAVLGLIGGILVWQAGDWPFVVVFLPLFPIFLDAAVTILRRARRGERLTAAHRDHLYQRLANEARWEHARVSLLYGAAAAVATIAVLSSRSRLAVTSVVYVTAMIALGFVVDRAAQRDRSENLK